jgi:hypothetical protein
VEKLMFSIRELKVEPVFMAVFLLPVELNLSREEVEQKQKAPEDKRLGAMW